MDVPTFGRWSTVAVNLPDHADNPVHTVEGGLAAGYDGAVVAGTTVYAYLTRPVAASWGLGWLAAGAAEVRFRSGVIADERVDIGSTGPDALVARVGERECAVCTVARSAPVPGPPGGDRLQPLMQDLREWEDYGNRIGDDLPLYADHGVVPPVAWPSLANRLFSAQLVDGSWVHTRSRISHLQTAPVAGTALVEGFLVKRFDSRAGERAVVDVRISVDGRPVAVLEHEAIVRLT